MAETYCEFTAISFSDQAESQWRIEKKRMCGMLLRCEPPVWRAIDTGSKRWPTQPTSTRKAETGRCRVLLRWTAFSVWRANDAFNLENSRAVVWKSSKGKMYLEVSHASAVWTTYVACNWRMIQEFCTVAEDGSWTILGTECDAWWHRVGNQFLRCLSDHEVATATAAPQTGAAPVPPPHGRS